jgi:hypothetical protein
MTVVRARANGLTVSAYRGDAKTLLAFNLTKSRTKNLAGFTIAYSTGAGTHYLSNTLQFADPSAHFQVAGYAPTSSINAPLHRFRWVHVPGAGTLGEKPAFGTYTYAVTPRYFSDGKLTELDPALSVSVSIDVEPFVTGALTASFTRGYVQSEAFVHRFGRHAAFRPEGAELIFDTSATAGTTPAGVPYTYRQQYSWLGFTARDTILGLLDDVLHDAALRLDVFAYDLNEPDVVAAILALAADGRVRMILDDSALHHSAAGTLPEDQAEARFTAAATAPAAIKRGKFARYSHDKVMIVHRTDGAGYAPVRVLTGSTNFSVNGLYVNANHVLVYDDPTVAATYATVFQNAWDGDVVAAAFRKTAEATTATTFASKTVPETVVTFSPHTAAYAGQVLDDLTARIQQENVHPRGSVLFAVMGLDGGGSVLQALTDLNADTGVFSYGISDTTSGIRLYRRGTKTGVLATGKPGATNLPPPFDQVVALQMTQHQVHHKFVVCGFNRSDAVVYCGSSNLALGGEKENGDNLLAVHDSAVATVFAIEALLLVDHFDFLDGHPAATAAVQPWTLSTTDRWTIPFYDPADLRCADRLLFG